MFERGIRHWRWRWTWLEGFRVHSPGVSEDGGNVHLRSTACGSAQHVDTLIEEFLIEQFFL